MFNIQLYLEKFKNIGQSEKLLNTAVLEVIKEVTGINLDYKNVSVKSGELFLKVSPGIRSAIFIKKELILNKIKERGTGVVINLR